MISCDGWRSSHRGCERRDRAGRALISMWWYSLGLSAGGGSKAISYHDCASVRHFWIIPVTSLLDSSARPPLWMAKNLKAKIAELHLARFGDALKETSRK